MPSVFISHKRGEPDDPIARLLAEELEKLGCSVYLDLNRPRAMEIDKEIPAYLDNADFVIAIISAAANDSDWVKGELKRAASLCRKFGHPRIVPIRLNFTNEYSPRLAAILDAFDPIYSIGIDDPELLPQVMSALGLGPFQSTVVRRGASRWRQKNKKLRIPIYVGAALVILTFSVLAITPGLSGNSDNVDVNPAASPAASPQPTGTPSPSTTPTPRPSRSAPVRSVPTRSPSSQQNPETPCPPKDRSLGKC